MRKILLSLLICTLADCGVYAQKEITIKAGTVIPVIASHSVKAADVTEGDYVDFLVAQNVYVDNICVIDRGAIVKGKVVQAKKSTIAGTKGRLGITIEKMTLKSGDVLFFTGSDIYIQGKNRTPLSVILGCFIWPCFFIPGSKAEMQNGYEAYATVATNVTTIIK